jgi:protein-tyrosine phosphatase
MGNWDDELPEIEYMGADDPMHVDNYYKDFKQPKRCYESHPVIKLLNGEVLGASCLNPRKGYDIYVGFDHNITYLNHQYPWEKSTDVQEFLFRIQDMSVPKSAPDFKALINWLHEQLQAGKKIHMGCIGGHGRTGMVLSALVTQITGELDSTTWVRENYCKKAVESSTQVNFLHKHYGIKKVGATKGKHSNKKGTVTQMNSSSRQGQKESIPHIESDFCIW